MANVELTHFAPFRLTLPNATVDETGTVSADLTTAPVGGPGSFTTLGASSTLTVGGTSTLQALSCTTLAASGAATFSSTLGVTGDFAVDTNKFTVAAATGNTAVGGTLAVTGALTATAGIVAGGDSVMGGLTVGAASVIVVDNNTNRLSFTIPTFADNAAALAGGLAVDNVYKTATGEQRIVV